MKKQKKLQKNLEVEIGDIVWYLASLSSAYHFEFEDVGNYLFQKKFTKLRIVNDKIVIESAKKKDLECLKGNINRNILIAYLDGINKKEYSFSEEWKKIVCYAYEIICVEDGQFVLEKSACLLVSLSNIVSIELGASMEQIL